MKKSKGQACEKSMNNAMSSVFTGSQRYIHSQLSNTNCTKQLDNTNNAPFGVVVERKCATETAHALLGSCKVYRGGGVATVFAPAFAAISRAQAHLFQRGAL